ncbi:uncharacterized protein DS421_20g698540 [Arachis hypogaea]|nr:uncharacterized protein DS421_20g698540 [Arachis hypogaea]
MEVLHHQMVSFINKLNLLSQPTSKTSKAQSTKVLLKHCSPQTTLVTDGTLIQEHLIISLLTR